MANYKLTNDYWETSGVYDITQGKTQREINADLKTSAESTIKPETVSGSIATFEGGEGVPLKNLTVNIEPIQSGSGDPSPTNIRPITGWTVANVTRSGKNIWGGEKLANDICAAISSATIDTSEKTVTFNSVSASAKVFIDKGFKENTQYTVILYGKNTVSKNTNVVVRYTDGTSYYSSFLFPENATNGYATYTTTAGKTIKNIGGVNMANSTVLYYDKCGVFEGTVTVDNFEEYIGNTYEFEFPLAAGTVYGGTLDVTNGVLTVTHQKVSLDENVTFTKSGTYENSYYSNNNVYSYPSKTGSLSGCSSHYKFFGIRPSTDGMEDKSIASHWVYKNVYIKDSTFANASELESYIAQQASGGTPVEFVYMLETPITYTLTPTEVKALLGTNNIWADTGDITVEYGAYLTVVENQLGEKIPKVAVAPIEKTTTASKAYAVNEMFFMGDKLYIVTSAIASGATFTIGTNCDETTLGEQIAALLNA